MTKKRVALVINLNSTTLSSYLTPLLAQYGIKYLDFLVIFLKEFGLYSAETFPKLFVGQELPSSENSRLSYSGLIVRVTMVFDIYGKYKLEFEKPSISFIVFYFLHKRYRGLRRWKKRIIPYFLYKLTYMLCFFQERMVLETQLHKTYKNLIQYLYRGGGKRWLSFRIERRFGDGGKKKAFLFPEPLLPDHIEKLLIKKKKNF